MLCWRYRLLWSDKRSKCGVVVLLCLVVLFLLFNDMYTMHLESEVWLMTFFQVWWYIVCLRKVQISHISYMFLSYCLRIMLSRWVEHSYRHTNKWLRVCLLYRETTLSIWKNTRKRGAQLKIENRYRVVPDERGWHFVSRTFRFPPSPVRFSRSDEVINIHDVRIGSYVVKPYSFVSK